MHFRAGQAAVETMLAVLVVTFVFLALFRLSHVLTGKILVEHAAMRVARARAVGFNDFMCAKAARVAVIPVAGKRLWPDPEEEEVEKVLDGAQNDKAFTYRVRTYLESPDDARARGLLEYENWKNLGIDSGDGGQSVVTLQTDWIKLGGKAGVEGSYTYYMEGGGN